MKYRCSVSVCAFVLATLSLHAGAENSNQPFDRIGLFAGYSRANLTDREEYERLPLTLRLSTNLDAVFPDFARGLPGTMRFNVEPFFTQTLSPGNRQEVGVAFMLRWETGLWMERCRFFVEGGAGPIYMTQETVEQSTQFNFIDQAGAGIALSATAEWDIELAYRYWHISNAGLDHPNSGINGSTVYAGISRSF